MPALSIQSVKSVLSIKLFFETLAVFGKITPMLEGSEETQAKIAADRLMSDIVTGVLVPGGKLRIVELKELYGIGASPLREALSRVTSLGYVTNESRRGYRVATMSQADLADITRARQLVELAMLRESLETRRDDWELGIVSSMEKLRWSVRKFDPAGSLTNAQVALAHKGLHVALVSGCSSPRLIAMQDLLFDQASRYREVMISEVRSGQAFLHKHESLVGTILEGDPDKALVALSDHLHFTLKDVYGAA